MSSTAAAALRAGRAATAGLLLLAALSFNHSVARGDDEWVELSGLEAWRRPTTNWELVGKAALNAMNPRKLDATPGAGVIYNGPTGRGINLVSKRTFGDVEVHAEFMIPKGSNSGIKLEEVYEIQISDSHDAKTLTASHCGGVYPRAELLPSYHHIDLGYPPKVNACRPPGAWQTLDIVFRAPRFDASGKKMANARFVSVKLNGQLVQESLDLPFPTGNNWRSPEHPTGRILLQGDHGAVAFRNVRARPSP
jgi:hypothetical protein